MWVGVNGCKLGWLGIAILDERIVALRCNAESRLTS